MDGNKELPIGASADEAVHGDELGDDLVVLPGAHEAGPPPPAPVALDPKAERMLDSYPPLASALAAYVRARQVYVIDHDSNALLKAQQLIIETMSNVAEHVELGAALSLNDSIIEVQFEVLSRLGMI